MRTNTSVFCGLWRQPNGLMRKCQANEQTTSKGYPTPHPPPHLTGEDRKTTAWTTAKILACWTSHVYHCASSTSQCVLCIEESVTFQWPLYCPCSTGVTQRRVPLGIQRSWRTHAATGKTKTCSFWLTHTSACLQMHNHTQRHSNKLLYICTVYPPCIVPDAVLCMLTRRWNVTITYKGDWTDRPWQRIDSLKSMQALCQLFIFFLCFQKMYTNMVEVVLPLPIILKKALAGQTALLMGF